MVRRCARCHNHEKCSTIKTITSIPTTVTISAIATVMRFFILYAAPHLTCETAAWTLSVAASTFVTGWSLSRFTRSQFYRVIAAIFQDTFLESWSCSLLARSSGKLNGKRWWRVWRLTLVMRPSLLLIAVLRVVWFESEQRNFVPCGWVWVGFLVNKTNQWSTLFIPLWYL